MMKISCRKKLDIPFFWHGFSTYNKNVIMEIRSNTIEKRKRKIVQKAPVLVRSVKPGLSANVWEKQSSSSFNLWKN